MSMIKVAALVVLAGPLASAAWAQTQNEFQKLLAGDGVALDFLGGSVALDGDTAVVGARGDNDNGASAGAAYIFVRDAGGSWTEQQELFASDGDASDRFGNSVDVDGDTLVIGASDHFNAAGSYTGAAYVFTRDEGGVWTEQQKLFASDRANIQDSDFGTSVAIDGDTVVVGDFIGDSPFLPGLCSCLNSGAAYVFTRDAGGVWTEQQKLFASDRASNDWFGNSVAVDGDRAVIGAWGNDDFGVVSGSAYVFFRDSEGLWIEQQKLTASDGAAGDGFGQRVAMDGDTAVIGAVGDDDNGDGSGTAYVFTRSPGNLWIEQPKLVANDAASGGFFGGSVAVHGDIAVIAGNRFDGVGTIIRSAYVFTRSAGDAWAEQQTLAASDGEPDDDFGISVAVHENTAVIGASLDDDNGDRSGSAYVFENLLPRFDDVDRTYWAFSFIDTLAASGITGGCGGNNYCPEDPVTRAQMAVFLERGINGSGYSPPAASGTIFADIGANDFAAAWIEQLFADGVTGGCGGGNYCPNDSVTRAQMAVFLLRAKFGSGYAPPPATGVFADVPVGSFADAWIEQLAADGITGGCGGGNYCPNNPVTRAQMAVFLVRAFGL